MLLLTKSGRHSTWELRVVSGADVLDFTLQNEDGRTLKWLCRGVIDINDMTPLRELPDGVESSAPFFIDIIPVSSQPAFVIRRRLFGTSHLHLQYIPCIYLFVYRLQ